MFKSYHWDIKTLLQQKGYRWFLGFLSFLSFLGSANPELVGLAAMAIFSGLAAILLRRHCVNEGKRR